MHKDHMDFRIKVWRKLNPEQCKMFTRVMDGFYTIPKCLAGTMPKPGGTRTKIEGQHDIILQLHESNALK